MTLVKHDTLVSIHLERTGVSLRLPRLVGLVLRSVIYFTRNDKDHTKIENYQLIILYFIKLFINCLSLCPRQKLSAPENLLYSPQRVVSAFILLNATYTQCLENVKFIPIYLHCQYWQYLKKKCITLKIGWPLDKWLRPYNI